MELTDVIIQNQLMLQYMANKLSIIEKANNEIQS